MRSGCLFLFFGKVSCKVISREGGRRWRGRRGEERRVYFPGVVGRGVGL